MKHLVYSFCVLFLLTACTTSSPLKIAEEEGVYDVVADKKLSLQVEGMACKYACGGEIRKKLKTLEGVTQIDIDFEDDREQNGVEIYFDASRVEDKEVIAAIEKINDGQFKVAVNKGVSEVENEVILTNSSKTDSEKSGIKAASESFEVPNILDLLSDLIVK